MPRAAKRTRVPPPIEADAWYDRHDLRLLLPWLGDEALAQLRRDGKLRYTITPGRNRDGIETQGQKILYKGQWLRDWLESFPVHGKETAHGR